MRHLVSALILRLAGTTAVAQSRFEAGAQLTALDMRESVGEKPLGVGGRFGYNLTQHLTMETELNYFPQSSSGNFGETQALFGVKAGQRFSDASALGGFGLFVKARPGIVHSGGPFFTRMRGAAPSSPAIWA